MASTRIVCAWLCAASAVACGTVSGPGAFCPTLDQSPDCTGEGSKCASYDKAARVESPTCGVVLDTLLECLSKASLSCRGGSDFEVFAAGSGATASRSVRFIGTYLLQLRTSECDSAADAWESCLSCGQALGYGGNAGGVGDPCTSSAQCVTGTTCQSGGCLKSCTRDSDCLPRFPGGPNGCQTSAGRSVACRSGTCATFCWSNAYQTYDCPPKDP